MAKSKKNIGKNPANEQSDLYKALTRLLSGPIINYRSESGRKIKKQHIDKYSSRFRSASGQQFKKQSYNPLDTLAANAIANQQRTERYIDFDQMEYMPEIASSLDIYADEMTTFSDLSPMLSIRCPNDEIKSTLNILYTKIMNIEYNLFGWCRTMCKYGDLVLYLDIDENTGIKSTIALPIQEIERLEGEDSTNPNYVQFQWNTGGMTFENWQIAHFRILGNNKYNPYGTSVLEPARRIWRQLTLMEDAMMAYRIVRSSERKLFKIDVGAVPPQEVEQFMQKIVSQLKRHSIVNKDTGRVDLRYNPMSIEEDYYIPVKAGSATDIQNISGGTNTTAIDDVKYLRDKLFSALKVPQSYLTTEEGGGDGSTALAQKNIRFARTIQRLQRTVIHELEKIGIVHLYTLGYRGDDLVGFKLALNNPSKIAELQELEHWKQKFDIAASATDGYFSRRWVADNIFNMSHEEFKRCQREMYYDRKHDAALESVVELGASADGGGGLGGGLDLGGDLGGGLDLGGGDEGGDLDLGADDAGEAPEEDNGLLAAPPGSRPSRRLSRNTEEARETPGSKGKKYAPVKPEDDRRRPENRRRNMAKAGKIETTPRAMNPMIGIPATLRSAANGVFESQEAIYSSDVIEEHKLLTIDGTVRTLIEGLQTRTTENDEE